MTARTRESRDGRIILFASYTGGTGRTMTLANVAWILAASGRRVLMIDWKAEASSLRRFFHPFIDPDQLTSDVIPINWRFSDGGSLDFTSAAMCEHLKQTYDYVLIDCRAGLSDVEAVCAERLPDDLVICFTLSGQSIEGAADMAAHVAGLAEPTAVASSRRLKIRILPVATRVEDAESERLEVGLAVARKHFAPYVREIEPGHHDHYWNLARIPYKPLYSYEELLAVFGDAPRNQASMLAAHERLAGLLTHGQVTSLPQMNESVRLRHKASFARARPTEPATIYISALPADQSWVTWLGWLLRALGYGIVTDATQEPDAHARRSTRAEATALIRAADWTIAVVSAAYPASPLGRAVGEAYAQPDATGSLIALQVDEPRPRSRFRNGHNVEAADVGVDELHTIAALLRGLGANTTSEHITAERALARATAAGERVRYPRSIPAVCRVPNRMATFTGREEQLDTLRRRLAPGASPIALPPQILYGLGGVGKTVLALEYAYRHQHEYDVIWWVRAEQPTSANEDLAQLGIALGIPPESSSAQATREALRSGKPYTRWLLIFDNADDPAVLSSLLPGARTGHVLVTSRNAAWTTHAEASEVDVFRRAESVSHLMRGVPGLSEAEADEVAEAVGDLPLAIGLAAAWLAETGTAAADYVERLRTEGSPILEACAVATWRSAIEQVGRTQPAAVHLLRLFSFFGPEPIALDLVYSDGMLAALLPLDPRLRNSMMLIGRYVQVLGRYSLVRVLRGDLEGVQVHRLIQQSVRDEITDAEERRRLRAQVHDILARARPAQGDVENPHLWPAYGMIWPHLAPSRAVTGNGEVRQLYIDRVRYLRIRGELRAALKLARETIETWSAEPRIGPDDARTLIMRFELACTERACGNIAQALEIDTDVLARQLAHEEFGPDHVASLMTAGGLAEDYRASGKFQQAKELDERTYRSFVEFYGTDHPRTLAAANNLAMSLRFAGRPFQALHLDRNTYEERLRVLGPAHPFTFSSSLNLARDLRDCGDRTFYLDLLGRTYEDCRSILGDENPLTHLAGQALATGLLETYRLLDAAAIVERLSAVPGAADNHVIRFGLDLAVAGLRAAQGDAHSALDLVTALRAGHEQIVAPGHPDLLVCMNNIAIYRRRLGETEEASAIAQAAYEGLSTAFGQGHLLALAGAINLANAWGECGRHEEAENLYRQTTDRLEELLAVPENTIGHDHPDLLACQANLAVTLHEMAGREREAEAERTLATLIEKLGQAHPNTVALSEWRRIDRRLDPLRL